jgi:phage FluMu protein Com
MADVFRAQCKVCGKEFKLRPDLLGREVRCPHCKAICKILPQTETAREAAEALRGEVPEHRPVTTHRQVVMPRGGVRHRSVAVVWVVLIGVVAIGLVVLLVVMARRPPPTAPAPVTTPGSGAVGAAGTPGTATPGTSAVAPTAEPVNLEIEKLVQGIQNGTRTYAVGTLTNQTTAVIREVEVEVGIFDAQEQELGRAKAQVRDLKPGEKAPVVAVWEHDPEVRGVKWVPNYDIPTTPPAGPPTNLVIAPFPSVPWFQPDAGSSEGTGKIVTDVKNQGEQAVSEVEVTAVMRDADGQVIGAARDVVRVTIMPGETKPVEIRYERCPDYRIGQPVQVRVQAAGQ